MGIDLHNLQLLAHARDLGASFTRTIGIGRQAVFIDARELEQHRALRGLPALVEPAAEPGAPRYFEPLMRQWLAAEHVDSVDASPYEGASLLHDMNLPWPAGGQERGGYDAVLDFGCLEHVFDFPTAWRNCVDLCRVGGHLLHSLPANNLAGHGFYQFSPELFFNLYQEKNGFALRGLWFALKADPRHWWRVADPGEVKRRVTLRNSHEVYLLVVATKIAEVGVLPAPQQSDYARGEWLKAAPQRTAAGSRGERAKAALATLGLLDAARAARETLRAWRGGALSLPAPDYRRVVVADLLQRGSPR
jgi:SAM-dependent methyltransferase